MRPVPIHESSSNYSVKAAKYFVNAFATETHHISFDNQMNYEIT